MTVVLTLSKCLLYFLEIGMQKHKEVSKMCEVINAELLNRKLRTVLHIYLSKLEYNMLSVPLLWSLLFSLQK